MTTATVPASGVTGVDISLAQGGANAALAATLLDDSLVAVNLTGCTIKLEMRDRARYLNFNESCTIVDAASGTVSYSWSADNAYAAVDLQTRFKVTTSGGVVTYYPSAKYLLTRVAPSDATVVSPLALTATDVGVGASLVGISDAGGKYTAVDVEGALAEVKTLADASTLATASLQRNTRIHLRAQVPSAAASNPYVAQTPAVITLPATQKSVQDGAGYTYATGWVRAGAGTLGALAAALGVAPTTMQIVTTPTGDILINAANGATSVDVIYSPERYDIVEGTYSCTPGTGVVAGLPSGIIFILEAESLVGGTVGTCIVQAPAGSAPTTRQAGLSLGKTGVFFCIADAVTSVRLKLGVIPAINL